MAIRPVLHKPVRSQIDWPIIGVAVAMAVVLVLSTTLMAWMASRSVHSVGRVSQLDLADSTQSVGDMRFQVDNGNEELPVGSYPEGDEQPATPGATRSDGPAGASPSRSVVKRNQGNEIQPAKAGSCDAGASEVKTHLLFAKDPAQAAELAKKEHKLMFVLHVSGNFEESKFT